MKILQIKAFGAPDVLRVAEVARPRIWADDEILVRVRASSVNFFALDAADMIALLDKAQTVQGFALLPLLQAGDVHRDLADLFRRVTSGRLQPVIGARFPLEQGVDAHRLLESRNSMGKVVLEV